MEAPIELLCVIMEQSKYSKVQKVFNKFKIYNQSTLMGKGTAKTALGDIFSFGIIDRDVLCAIVDVSQSEEICLELDKALNSQSPNGVVFTVPIDAISSDLFNEIMGRKRRNGKSKQSA